MADHDCAHHGHVWVEPDGKLYTRHNQRPQSTVNVTCRHCEAVATLPTYARHTAPPRSIPNNTGPARMN